jgi:hypothetical protein
MDTVVAERMAYHGIVEAVRLGWDTIVDCSVVQPTGVDLNWHVVRHFDVDPLDPSVGTMLVDTFDDEIQAVACYLGHIADDLMSLPIVSVPAYRDLPHQVPDDADPMAWMGYGVARAPSDPSEAILSRA